MLFLISQLPQNILLSILSKLDGVSWFRLRQTSKFINQFAEENEDSFPLRRIDRNLNVFWSRLYGSRKLKAEHEISVSTDSEYDIGKAELLLKGLLFTQITLSCNRYCRDEERPEILSAMTAFCEKLPLHCDVLFYDMRWLDYLPKFCSIITSVSTISVKVESYSETCELLEIIDHQMLKRITGFIASGYNFSDCLLSLTKRFQFLKLTDGSADCSKTRANLATFLQDVRLGGIRGNVSKWLKYTYKRNRADDIENTEEVKDLEKKVIWKGKRKFTDDEEEEEIDILVFQLESILSSYTATVVLIVADVFALFKKATVYVDLRGKQEAQEDRELILERIFEDVKEDRMDLLRRKKEKEENEKINIEGLQLK